jgi:acyl-[acyl-carrier-protein]-phospholipid O-acyltransferase/long-chain-fatty-acid--[acyl-carrier-protein] ligase
MGEERRDEKGFWALIVAQFLGAFNDNAWKTCLQILASTTVPDSDRKSALIAIATAVFTLPFLLFSMHAGGLADRYSKRSVLIASKFAEVATMALGIAAFLSGGSFTFLMIVLFLQGAHSAYYGPAKYGILPEILPTSRLSWGNGVLEMTTFLGIILGMAAGALCPVLFMAKGAAIAGSRLWQFSVILTFLAVLGSAANFLVARVGAADPGRRVRLNPLGDLLVHGRAILSNRVLFLTSLGIVYFWFLGALASQNVFLYAGEGQVAGPLIGLTVGIGVGSILSGRLSGKTIELGLVPLGSLGLSLFSIALYFTHGSSGLSLTALVLLGLSGGLFIVPLSALLQEVSPPAEKGSLIAVTQFASFAAMLAAAGAFRLLTAVLHLSPPAVFLAGGLLTLAGSAYVLRLLPEALGRLLLWLATHSVYRVRVRGRENLPDRGPALLLANHVSYVDGLLILATTHRLIRFIMYKGITDLPVVRWLARLLRVIPISAEDGPKTVILAFRTAEEALRQGELVCIFPEGQISRIGQMLPFRKGFERIVKDLEVPLVPVHLDRVWGSIFSFQGGRFLLKWPRRWPYPVTVSFGKPLPKTASAFEVRQAISELGSEAAADRKGDLEPLTRAFVRTARRRRRRLALADSGGTVLRFGQALAKSLGLARRLRPHWEGQENVGILLPTSVGGALANAAALLAGRVPVNLNYTASAEALQSAARQCGLSTVLTARAFLEKVKVELPAKAIYLEDLAAPPSLGEKLCLGLAAALAPRFFLERLAGSRRAADPSSVATILFSSGSTGDPKGVLLTHANLLSNIQSLEQLFDPNPHDRVMGVLPFFHSFGVMGTLWFPLVAGIGAVYHPNPLDARGIAEAVRQFACTFLLATPTFLQSYIRRSDPAAFGSLRHVVVGAEKLSPRVADAFSERFGIEPLEGYGSTECSPLVAVNVPDHRGPGIHQVGTKRGRIGHPIPGVSVRVVDPETFSQRPPGQEGLLLVKGPNVMAGYLGRPDLTREVVRDGWYVTGDLAVIDEDGFITITDRLSRFSKIGGEMVPHLKVEEALHGALGASEQVLAVTSLPDQDKGERLVVVHTLDDQALGRLQEKLLSLGLPNLWLPRKDSFLRVDRLPLLGTGKLDLRKVRELARAGSADQA